MRLAYSLVALVAPAVAAPETCSAVFAPCYDTRCCSNYGFACFKKAGKAFAQCKRKDTACGAADPEWECPGELDAQGNPEAAPDATQCQNNFKECTLSGCCSSSGFGCFKRPNSRYAQCRPIDPTRQCVSTNDWMCPGTWTPPSAEEIGVKCSKPFDSCVSSKCCVGQLFQCYEQRPQHAQCLRSDRGCTNSDGQPCKLIEMEHAQAAHPHAHEYGGVAPSSSESSTFAIVLPWLLLLVALGLMGYTFRAHMATLVKGAASATAAAGSSAGTTKAKKKAKKKEFQGVNQGLKEDNDAEESDTDSYAEGPAPGRARDQVDI